MRPSTVSTAEDCIISEYQVIMARWRNAACMCTSGWWVKGVGVVLHVNVGQQHILGGDPTRQGRGDLLGSAPGTDVHRHPAASSHIHSCMEEERRLATAAGTCEVMHQNHASRHPHVAGVLSCCAVATDDMKPMFAISWTNTWQLNSDMQHPRLLMHCWPAEWS